MVSTWAFASSVRERPHWPQNLLPGGLRLLHLGQVTGSRAFERSRDFVGILIPAFSSAYRGDVIFSGFCVYLEHMVFEAAGGVRMTKSLRSPVPRPLPRVRYKRKLFC